MSASIYYQAVKPNKGANFNVSSPSSFLTTMGECFGDPPFILNGDDIPILSGMAATWSDKNNNPFEKLIEEIEKKDTIEVWAEY